MALVACSECNGSVSDQATACPHCGNPLRKKKITWAEASEKARHDSKREEWITGIVGRPPSGWLWGVVPFVLLAILAGALDSPTLSAWAFPAAFGTYLLSCWPHWVRKRQLRQLDDSELQRLFANAKGIDLEPSRKEPS
jgi:hypothetical protein